MRISARHVFILVLLLAGGLTALGGCDDSSTPSGPDGGPAEGVGDTVALSLYTFDDGGGERLRWVGTPDGPLPSSPEGTAVPWVGFAVPFEMRWTVGSDSGRIDGYRWKASQLPDAPFFPPAGGENGGWASTPRAEFANDHDPSTLDGSACPDGFDCPSLRRWVGFSPIPFRFQLEARDESGRVQHFEFGFQVNYPPDTHFLEGERPDGIDPPDYPRYWYFDDQGGWTATSFSDGDTIPSGAYAVFAVEAEDRFPSTASSDSFCCDVPLTPESDILRRQWRFDGSEFSDGGQLREIRTQWTPPAVEDTLGFFVGPFDYEMTTRSWDEHGRIDRSEDRLDFVAGFRPRLTAVTPGEGDLVVLAEGGTWPQTTLPVQVSTGVTRFWDPSLRLYQEQFLSGTQGMQGTLYRLPLRFESQSDPRQRGLLPASGSTRFGGVVRSWTYRYLSEFDAENRSLEGPGDGDLRFFVNGRSDGNFEPSEGVEIFVPDAFWQSPEMFDPDGDCVVPSWCDQGRFIQRSLGQIALTGVGKTTDAQSVYRYFSNSVRPGENEGQSERDLSELGRRTDLKSVQFEVWLGLEQEGSAEPMLWPTASPARSRR